MRLGGLESSGSEAVVFVVDDDRAVREAITSLIASVGLRVESFQDGGRLPEARTP